MVVNTGLADHLIVKRTHSFLQQLPVSSEASGVKESEEEGKCVMWEREGEKIRMKHLETVQQVCWHGKGDYLASVTAAPGKLCMLYLRGEKLKYE